MHRLHFWIAKKIALAVTKLKYKKLLVAILLALPGQIMAQSSTVTSTSATSISGTATASSGETVEYVDLAVRTSNLYWNGSTLQSAWTRVRAQVNGSNWTYVFSDELPDATYFVTVRAIDSGGSVQETMTSTYFVVGTNLTNNDTVRPTSIITETTASRIGGEANDNNGVSSLDRVELVIRNSDVQFWNGDSFTSNYARVIATLQTNGQWFYDLGTFLDPDIYFIRSIAVDSSQNQQLPFDEATLDIVDDVPPTSEIVSMDTQTIIGTAQDDIAIGAVELAISNGNGFWDGTRFTEYGRVTANISANAGSVNWEYNFGSVLPDGGYSVTAIAFDTYGNPQSPFTKLNLQCGLP